VFKDILKLDGLNLVYDKRPPDLYFHFRDALHGHRFDGIAGAVQRFLEENLCRWVRAGIEETGLKRIVFGGGISQNIKAMKRLMEMEEVEEIFVCPAGGDTSLPIGACQYLEWKHLMEEGGDMDRIEPLPHTYLGPDVKREDAIEAFGRRGTYERFEVQEGVTADQVAERLAQGRILARCAGPMEFGLRALGNRSILADPRNPDTVRRINAAIKFRDFWMPFTPSVLADRAGDYLVNEKQSESPFMTMAFDTTPLGQKEIPAALHPADQTARPQILERDKNPEYYEIIKAFEERTGVGAVLNTSFNLHGEPIALSADAALHTLEDSDLDDLVVGDFLVSRRREA
jgi:carbamoyltransferase